jgi:hypothetical protein
MNIELYRLNQEQKLKLLHHKTRRIKIGDACDSDCFVRHFPVPVHRVFSSQDVRRRVLCWKSAAESWLRPLDLMPFARLSLGDET